MPRQRPPELRLLSWLGAVALSAPVPGGGLPAAAVPPPPDAFDGETILCQPAGSAATVLICRDAELTALDRQLRARFRQLRDAPHLTQTQREVLVDDQRRWVESIDQCWRAGENLRNCVRSSQERRLEQLRAWSEAAGLRRGIQP